MRLRIAKSGTATNVISDKRHNDSCCIMRFVGYDVFRLLMFVVILYYMVVELYIYRTYELDMLLARFREFGVEVK